MVRETVPSQQQNPSYKQVDKDNSVQHLRKLASKCLNQSGGLIQRQESDLQRSVVFQNVHHIGETQSAQELQIFLCRERLRLYCGI